MLDLMLSVILVIKRICPRAHNKCLIVSRSTLSRASDNEITQKHTKTKNTQKAMIQQEVMDTKTP